MPSRAAVARPGVSRRSGRGGAARHERTFSKNEINSVLYFIYFIYFAYLSDLAYSTILYPTLHYFTLLHTTLLFIYQRGPLNPPQHDGEYSLLNLKVFSRSILKE